MPLVCSAGHVSQLQHAPLAVCGAGHGRLSKNEYNYYPSPEARQKDIDSGMLAKKVPWLFVSTCVFYIAPILESNK